MKLYGNIIYYSLWKGKLTDRLHLFSQKIKEKSWQLILLPLIISLFSSTQTFAYDCSAKGTSVNVNECNALIDFYNSTGGENWSDAPGNNWNVEGTTPCADWAGITCTEGGQVTAIDRKGRNLVGTLPDLSALTVLDTLDLRSNQLSGPVSNVSGLTNLVYLYLSKNQFSGSIPDLSKLNGLKELILDGNQLTGSIPSSLTTLTQLKWLVLRSNQLTGSLPDLSTLTQLRYLYLGKNAFGGTIPSFLTKLTQLQELDLELTQLSGPIPDLSTLTELLVVDLSKNQLSGEIPSSLAKLSKLQELLIEGNALVSTCDPTLVAFLNSKSLEWKTQAATISCSPPPPPGAQTLTVVKKGTGLGKVTASAGLGDGIHCGEVCTEYYSPGSEVQLTAIADEDSLFSGWNSECSDSLIITNNMRCTATFEKKTTAPTTPVLPSTWPVTVIINGGGQVKAVSGNTSKDCLPSQGCLLTVTSGGSASLEAIAQEDSLFSGWTCQIYGLILRQESTTVNNITLNAIQEARTCTAAFVRPLTVVTHGKGKVNVQIGSTPKGGATIETGMDCGTDCTKFYFPDTTITLVPKAESDAYFSHWEGDPDCLDGQIKMSESKSCVAYFQAMAKLTMKVVGNGSVKGGDMDCQQECLHTDLPATQITFAAVPAAGYRFQNWSEACTGTTPVITITLDQAETCIAHFVQEEFLIPQVDELEKLLVSINHQGTLEQPAVETLNTLSEELLTVAQTAVQNYQEVSQKTLDENRVEPLAEFEAQLKPLQDKTTTIAMLVQNIVEQLRVGNMFLSQELVSHMTDEELARILGEIGVKAHLEAGIISAERSQTINQLGIPANLDLDILDFSPSCSLAPSSSSSLDSVLDIFFPKAEAAVVLGCIATCKASFDVTCVTCIATARVTLTDKLKGLISEYKKCSGWFGWLCRIKVIAKIVLLVG